MFCLGSGFQFVYEVWDRESCLLVFKKECRGEIEISDTTSSLMALLRTEILQANSSHTGAFKYILGGKAE